MNNQQKNKKWIKYLILLVIGLIVFLIYFFLGLNFSSKSDFDITGIDVSHHNTVNDWQAISRQAKFCFIKATEGDKFVDPKFKSYWNESKKNHIIHGAYHFFSPGISAEKQFNNFKNTVTLTPGDLPPVLDVEKKECDMDEVNKWLKMAEKHYGVKPIIYSDYFFFKILIERKLDNNYPLWLYVNQKYNLKPSSRKTEFEFWQYNQHGKMNGIAGEVDFDAFLGDSENLKNILIK